MPIYLLLAFPYSRFLALAGEHGGQGQKLGMEEGSFLLDSNSMFRYCTAACTAGRYCQLAVTAVLQGVQREEAL